MHVFNFLFVPLRIVNSSIAYHFKENLKSYSFPLKTIKYRIFYIKYCYALWGCRMTFKLSTFKLSDTVFLLCLWLGLLSIKCVINNDICLTKSTAAVLKYNDGNIL